MTVLILDTETTGLVNKRLVPLARQPKIIEFFGLSCADDGEELTTYSQLFNPELTIEPVITRITGLRDSDLVNQPTFAEKAAEVKALIESHSLIVAHNMSFDKQMIDFEMTRSDMAIEWPPVLCTVEATEHIKGYRLNLMKLHEFLFGEAFTEAHRAETDVRALARCYFELKNREVA